MTLRGLTFISLWDAIYSSLRSSLSSLTLLTVLCIESEIGIGLTGMGLLFTMLGVLLFFDGGLLAVGNVSLLISPFHVQTLTLRSCYLPLPLVHVQRGRDWGT